MFMETLLNDCSGEILDDGSDSPADPKEMSFLVLRVLIIQASNWLYFWIGSAIVRESDSWVQSPNESFFSLISRLLVSWVKPCKLSAPAWFPPFCGVPRKPTFHCQTRRQLYRPLGWWILTMRYDCFTLTHLTSSLKGDDDLSICCGIQLTFFTNPHICSMDVVI